MSGESLEIYRGDDRSITLTITEPNASATDLTGVDLWFSVWSADNTSRIIDKDTVAGITIESPATAGIATVAIANADTASLDDADLDTPLIWEAQMKKDGAINTVARGYLTIITDIITDIA